MRIARFFLVLLSVSSTTAFAFLTVASPNVTPLSARHVTVDGACDVGLPIDVLFTATFNGVTSNASTSLVCNQWGTFMTSPVDLSAFPDTWVSVYATEHDPNNSAFQATAFALGNKTSNGPTTTIDAPSPVNASNQAAYPVSGDCAAETQAVQVAVTDSRRNSPTVTTNCVAYRYSVTVNAGMLEGGPVSVTSARVGSYYWAYANTAKTTSIRWRHPYAVSFASYVSPSKGSDLVWRHASGAYGYWQMPQMTPVSLPSIPGGSVIGVASLRYSFVSDLLWRDAQGNYYTWLGPSPYPPPGAPPCMWCPPPPPNPAQIYANYGANWEIAGVGDFNGNGTDDILWKTPSNAYGLWLMSSTVTTGGGGVMSPGPGYKVTLVADFNGDGKSDLLWTHADGSVVITLMDGANVTLSQKVLGPGTGWTPMITGDFNADDKADILWKHTDGSWGIWLQDGVNVLQAAMLPDRGPGNGWNARFIRDFDGDGFGDILWESADGTGAYEAWRMNGATIVESKHLLDGGSGWRVHASSDYSGDGLDDLLWRSDAGEYGVWYMNGLTPTTIKSILPGGTGWEVVPK